MPSGPPPPRFRVVERGRRLEVIDTSAPSDSARPRSMAPRDGALGWWPRATRFDGTAEFRTLRLYDAKGPRLVTLDPGAAARVGYLGWVAGGTAALAIVLAALQPWLLAGGIALANPKLRERLRGWTTRLVDRAAMR